MDLQKLRTDTKLFGYLIMGLAAVFLFIFFFVFGLAAVFFIVLFGWLILLFYYLRFLVTYNFTARLIVLVLAIILTFGIFFWARIHL